MPASRPSAPRGLTALDSSGSACGAALAAYQQSHQQLAARISNPKQLHLEYRHVVALDKRAEGACSEAVADDETKRRNRYVNVLPFDHNRVRLGSDGDYINASPLRASCPAAGGSYYVATQGPLPTTTPDFWTMTLQVAAPAIVMLGNLSERGVTKCAPYFPTASRPVLRAGALVVRLISQRALGDEATLRVLELAGCGVVRTVHHLHYHAWPDHGIPSSSAGVRSMCHYLAELRANAVAAADAADGAAAAATAGAAPVVVHCSAGIGRTGTFCAIDIVLRQLRAWRASPPASGDAVADALDIPRLVHGLRMQRMGCVQNADQYRFIYIAVRDELASLLSSS